MSQVWIVTVPNNKENSKTVFSSISNQLNRGATQVSRFKVPELVVGTLDSLIALSDDLSKISTQIENVVRKVERQYTDIAGDKASPLQINGVNADVVFDKFEWNKGQFQLEGKPLGDLVAQIQAIASKTDEELKVFSSTYTEKNLALQNAKRRQAVNLATSDFEDFLKPEDVAKLEILNTESLLTLTVVVPKALEQEFKATYHTIGGEIAAFGGPDWTNSSAVGTNDGKFGPNLKRSSVKGSPVVPGSLKLIVEEGDFVLFAVTVLRGHYTAGYFEGETFIQGKFVDYLEQIKAAFREKRFAIREFSYDSSKSGGIKGQIEKANADLKQYRTSTIHWCQTHFGEVYGAWIHLKIIQAFVESVLRYGLPVDFTSFFVRPDSKQEKEVRAALVASILSLRPELRPKKALIDEEEEEDSEANLPFVFLKFSAIGLSHTV